MSIGAKCFLGAAAAALLLLGAIVIFAERTEPRASLIATGAVVASRLDSTSPGAAPSRVAAVGQEIALQPSNSTAAIRLLDQVDDHPLSARSVTFLWGETRRAQTDADGVFRLPAEALPVDACCAVEGYYPEDLRGAIDGVLRLRRNVVVAGYVQAPEGIDVTGLVVTARSVVAQPPLAIKSDPVAVGKDLRFEFIPKFWAEQDLELSWNHGGRLSTAIATTRWRPGDLAVTMVVAGAASPPQECVVEVDIEFDPAVQVEFERSRAAKLAMGRVLDPRYGDITVELQFAGRGRGEQRFGRIVDGHCRISDLAAQVGECRVMVACCGYGLQRVLGPFSLNAPTTRLHCVVESAGEVEVRMSGAGVAELVHNPVLCLVRDAMGRQIGAFYAEDGATDGSAIPGRLLPLGQVSLWPFASVQVGDRTESRVAMPTVTRLRQGERAEVGFMLTEAAYVVLDFSKLDSSVTHAVFVEPVSGARWALGAPSVSGGRGHQATLPTSASWRVAQGSWLVEIGLEDGSELRVPVEVHRGRNDVLVKR